MANNADILGEEAAVRQIVENDFSATNGVFRDDSTTFIKRASTFRFKTTLYKLLLPGLNSIIETNGVYGCYNLTLADIGGCTRLQGTVFMDDSALIALIIRKTDAVTMLTNVNVFQNTKYATNGAGGAYVYVPRDLISTYQAATNWATLYAAHSDMFRPLEDYTVDGTTTGDFDESKL